MKKLNLGAGKQILKGYVNLDMIKIPGIDVMWNINQFPYPFHANAFDEVFCNHILEHADYLPRVMKELWRISRPNAKIIIKAPYFACSGAFNNPEHKSFLTHKTFSYLQPYWGSFKTTKRKLLFTPYGFFRILNPIFNIFPAFYERFLCFIIPCSEIHYELKVIKNEPEKA